MRTSARPRTLVLVVSDVVIDVLMLGPQGHELGARQVVPVTTETATLWNAIEQLGEFDRVTLVGADRHGLADKIVRQSQRPLRQISLGQVHWKCVISGNGVELALTLGARLGSTLYHDGVEVPGCDLGMQLVRKDRRLREYLAHRVLERKGADAWSRRVTRAVGEILAVWNPSTLYIAVPPTLPMPEMPSQVVVVPARLSFEDALAAWNAELAPSATTARSRRV